MGGTHDYSNIRGQGIFFAVSSLIEVEVIINSAESVVKQPAQYCEQIVHQVGMEGRFPHQVLLGGMGIVVVFYLVFNLPGHLCYPFVSPVQSSLLIQGLSTPTMFFWYHCTGPTSICKSPQM